MTASSIPLGNTAWDFVAASTRWTWLCGPTPDLRLSLNRRVLGMCEKLENCGKNEDSSGNLGGGKRRIHASFSSYLFFWHYVHELILMSESSTHEFDFSKIKLLLSRMLTRNSLPIFTPSSFLIHLLQNKKPQFNPPNLWLSNEITKPITSSTYPSPSPNNPSNVVHTIYLKIITFSPFLYLLAPRLSVFICYVCIKE